MRHFSPTRLLFLILFSVGTGMNAQEGEWKVHLQITANLGYPQDNLGLRIIGEYLHVEDYELSLGYGITYNVNNYGPTNKHVEHSILGSAHYTWGGAHLSEEESLSYIKFLDSRRQKNSIGYTWQRFFNSIGTSQNVGTIHMRFNKTVSQFSNDVFANTNGKDRYRTGAFAFGFYHDRTLLVSKLLVWTGDTHCADVERVKGSTYPARWGYRDISDCQYGKLSHGIFGIGLIREVDYGNSIGMTVGIDSEHIRNFVQNKVFHDLYFIPSFMNNARNLHLPMKTPSGENYLYEKGQNVRKNRFVWQLSSNPSTMY